MRVIVEPVADPAAPLSVLGEQMRAAALASNIGWHQHDMVVATPSASLLVSGDQTMRPMMRDALAPFPRQWARGAWPRANAGIMTSAGFLPVYANEIFAPVIGNTTRFRLDGTTRDSTGALLVSCEVWLFNGSGVHIDTVISDAVAATYTFYTADNSGPFFVVAWKTSDTLRGATARGLTLTEY